MKIGGLGRIQITYIYIYIYIERKSPKDLELPQRLQPGMLHVLYYTVSLYSTAVYRLFQYASSFFR